MGRKVCFILILLLLTTPAWAQYKMRFNPHTNKLDWVVDINKSYEYRRYSDTDDSRIYEGWTEWTGDDADTSAEIWRIGVYEYSETGTVFEAHETFAGTGEFIYAWDNRESYFGFAEFVTYQGAITTFGGNNVTFNP